MVNSEQAGHLKAALSSNSCRCCTILLNCAAHVPDADGLDDDGDQRCAVKGGDQNVDGEYRVAEHGGEEDEDGDGYADDDDGDGCNHVDGTEAAFTDQGGDNDADTLSSVWPLRCDRWGQG